MVTGIRARSSIASLAAPPRSAASRLSRSIAYELSLPSRQVSTSNRRAMPRPASLPIPFAPIGARCRSGVRGSRRLWLDAKTMYLSAMASSSIAVPLPSMMIEVGEEVTSTMVASASYSLTTTSLIALGTELYMFSPRWSSIEIAVRKRNCRTRTSDRCIDKSRPSGAERRRCGPWGPTHEGRRFRGWADRSVHHAIGGQEGCGRACDRRSPRHASGPRGLAGGSEAALRGPEAPHRRPP